MKTAIMIILVSSLLAYVIYDKNKQIIFLQAEKIEMQKSFIELYTERQQLLNENDSLKKAN